MSEKNSLYLKKLQQIRASGDYRKLLHYKKAESWSDMNEEEKSALANLFILQGEEELRRGVKKIPEAFKFARKLAPSDAHVLTMSAYAHLFCKKSKQDLLRACDLAKRAVEVNPSHIEAWSVWGTALLQQALDQDLESFYQEAHEKFSMAYRVKNSESDLKQDVYFQWALALCGLARSSGEPRDYNEAIGKFRHVARLGEVKDPFFWDHYGNILVECAFLINCQASLREALTCYRRATELLPDFAEAWFHLATCCWHLWDIYEEDGLFKEADCAFEEASSINPEEGIYWMRWGELLYNASLIKGDFKQAVQAIEHLEKARFFSPNNHFLSALLAEVYLFIGKGSESLSEIKEAESAIEEAISLSPNEPRYRAIYAACLQELGVYFDDSSYFYQSNTQLRKALEKEADNPLAWYSLAQNLFILGSKEAERRHFKRALSYCSRAVEFEKGSSAYLLFFWGAILVKLADFSDSERYLLLAIEKFEQILWPDHQERPTSQLNPEWLFHYGCALDCLGEVLDENRHDERIGYYERSIKALSDTLILSSEFPEARYHLALAFGHLGKATSNLESYYKASELLKQFTASDPENEGAWNEWGLLLIEIAQIIKDPASEGATASIYSEAEEKLLRAAALGYLPVNYNLAALYTLNDQPDLAIHYLQRGYEMNSLPSVDFMLHDTWLEKLHDTPDFQLFIRQMQKEP